MKSILIILALLCFCLISKAQIKIDDLKKDPEFIAYKKVCEKIKANMLSHYYGPTSKFASLPIQLAKAKTSDDMRAILKTDGIPHGDEFVDALTSQTAHMNNFIKNHPEMKSLSPPQMNEVLAELLKGI